MKTLMIAWVGYQRRAHSMQQYWAYDLLHLPNLFRARLARPLDYLIKTVKTIKALVAGAPDCVWVQLPPSPVLHIVLLYKVMFNRRLNVIVDAHNSLLREHWIRFPGTLALLNNADAVIAHNFKAMEALTNVGVNAGIIFILEDLPCDFNVALANRAQTPYVLFPCSFDRDEPVGIVIDTATHMPGVDFYITGHHKGTLSKTLMASLPANIKFTGFLSKQTFEHLLCNANVVLGLTTRDDVQLSVANEAVSAGRPMALSDTTVLRSLFAEAAVFVDTLDALSIKAGISQLLNDQSFYEERSAELKIKRIARWKEQAARLNAAVIRQ